jgi:DNA polymerase-3 subunit delta
LKLRPDNLAAQLEQRLLPVYLISGDEPLQAGEAADSVCRLRANALPSARCTSSSAAGG